MILAALLFCTTPGPLGLYYMSHPHPQPHPPQKGRHPKTPVAWHMFSWHILGDRLIPKQLLLSRSWDFTCVGPTKSWKLLETGDLAGLPCIYSSKKKTTNQRN